MPNILQFLSYSFNVNGCMVGPFYEYRDFIEMIEKKGRYENIPSPILPTMNRFLHAHICLVLNFVGFMYFDPQFPGKEEYG